VNNLESLLSSLAKAALSSKDDTIAWPWKLLAGIVVAVGVFWLRWQLAQKEEELAHARAELEKERFESQWDLVKAHVGTLNEEAERGAKEALAHADAALAGLATAEARFASQKTAVEKLASFEDLNRLAGVAS
jgi:hypothetical protein